MVISTQISNGTKHEMKVVIGSSELATVKAGGKYVIGVDYNATYREYTVGVDAAKFVVSSDDLCDNKCITIKEEADSKFTVQKEPRQSSSGASTSDGAVGDPPKKHMSWLRSWMPK